MEIYNLLNYIVSGNEQDEYSRAILEFKKGKSLYVRNLIKCSEYFAESKLKGYDYIVRALGSDELKASGGNQLDYLCWHIATKIGAMYLKDVVFKNEKKSQLKKYASKSERSNHLINNINIKNEGIDLSNSKILIVDDVYTTGATVEMIKMLINRAFVNCQIDAFVLGKSTHSNEQLDVSKHCWSYKVEEDYYDDSEYASTWARPGYTKVGFLRAKHDIFPQEWDCKEVYTRKRNDETTIYCQIHLEESKELFLIELGRFLVIFKNTDFMEIGDDYVDFNNEKYFMGVDGADPYIIDKNYKDIFTERISKK